MKVAIHFDVICPWCYIGLKRLGLALARRPGLKPSIQWRPYFLNPDLPDTGIDFSAYVERKFGGVQRAQRLLHSLEEIGKTVGIAFDFAAIQKIPPTLDAHRLIRLAHLYGKQTEVAEALFAAHFTQGRNIGEPEVLIAEGKMAGLSETRMTEALADDDLAETLRSEAEAMQRSGTLGVPLFAVDDGFVITGAHEPEVLVRLFDVAAAAEEDERQSSGSFTTPLPQSPPTPA
jgi:predicted DsbA family dithiol-disulfide isomerase